eukprot:10846215-Prorocentrum_lima.AAC.1
MGLSINALKSKAWCPAGQDTAMESGHIQTLLEWAEEFVLCGKAHVFGELVLVDPELGAAALPVGNAEFITGFLKQR